MKSKIPLYFLVFFFCFIFLTGCTSKENIEISQGFVKEALELYDKREYLKSVEKFVEALDKYPANFDAYTGIMNIFVQKGLLDEAKDLAHEASLRLGKEEACEIYSLVGYGYYDVQKFDDAKKMFEKFQDCDQSKVGLAQTYIQKDEISNAQKALKGSSKDENYLLLKAYLTLDDWKKGSSNVEEIDLNEIDDEAIKEKINMLREIYTIDDEDAFYKNTSLAGQYINSGYGNLAIRILGEHKDEVEEYPDAQYFLGRAYLDSGEYDKAIEKLSNATLLDPANADAYVSLARAYLFNKNVERALDFYKVAVSVVDPEKSARIVKEYVGVLIDKEMMSVAESLLTNLVSEKESLSYSMILADLYYKQKSLAKMDDVLKSLEKESNLTQAETKELLRLRLLYLMEDIKDVKEVEDFIERYSVFDRYNPEIFLFKGKIYKYEGDKSKAKEAFERAIEVDLEGSVLKEAEKLLATVD